MRRFPAFCRVWRIVVLLWHMRMTGSLTNTPEIEGIRVYREYSHCIIARKKLIVCVTNRMCD